MSYAPRPPVIENQRAIVPEAPYMNEAQTGKGILESYDSPVCTFCRESATLQGGLGYKGEDHDNRDYHANHWRLGAPWKCLEEQKTRGELQLMDTRLGKKERLRHGEVHGFSW